MDSATKPRQFALRFISGKYQGGEFPISQDKDVIIGRANELEVVLVEDMVSRRHAHVFLQSDGLYIEDLGSTNGTFVNGEKIKRTKLKEGDRILIGTSIIRVALTDAGDAADARAKMQDMASARRTSQVRTMTGNIEEVPLVDLLQLFTSSKKSGVLVLRRDDDVGKIFLRRGVVAYATINNDEQLGPLRSVYRLLAWDYGTFELDPPDDREFPDELNLPTEAILMEGMRQIDELRRIQPELPPPDAHFAMVQPLEAPLHALKPDELAIFQLALNNLDFATILSRSTSSDLDTCEVVVRLLRQGYLCVVE